MGEHKIPREVNNSPKEEFQINDPEIGKTFAIRECTDEQLDRYAANAEQAHRVLTHQAMSLIGQGVEAAKAAAIMRYEQDRRRRTITLATPGDVSRLIRQ